MARKSRSRKNKCRNFQVNILEDIRDIAHWASGELEKPLYEIVEDALLLAYGEKYMEYMDKKGE